jgi:hypothetical protein
MNEGKKQKNSAVELVVWTGPWPSDRGRTEDICRRRSERSRARNAGGKSVDASTRSLRSNPSSSWTASTTVPAPRTTTR